MSATRAVLVLVLAAPLLVSTGRAFADGEAPAPPPPSKDLILQSDRRKLVSIMVPKTWKSTPGDQTDEKALASLGGFFGEPEKSPNGFVFVFMASQFARATLARAVELPQVGEIKAGTDRQGPGWAEACAIDQKNQAAFWQRYVEKNGRVYKFIVKAHMNAYDAVHEQVEKMLDTATITGEFAPPALQPGWTLKKMGEFDVITDASADREKSVGKQKELLAAGREVLAKTLPGKPFDASRPTAWVCQNAVKYEEKLKAAVGVAPKFAAYEGVDRASIVELMSEDQKEHEPAVLHAGAAQYVWQYFGGETPPWISIGLAQYGQTMAGAGGKGKLPADLLTRVKAAAAAGKRKLNEWFDVLASTEIVDIDQGSLELFAWQTYFRTGRGVKKYKKQYDAYIQTLHDTGDPAAARKSFDGANFDEMLSDFKAWAAEWK
jgi:hypothetical protein